MKFPFSAVTSEKNNLQTISHSPSASQEPFPLEQMDYIWPLFLLLIQGQQL